MERSVRAAATASVDEGEFVRWSHRGGVLIRPRYAAGDVEAVQRRDWAAVLAAPQRSRDGSGHVGACRPRDCRRLRRMVAARRGDTRTTRADVAGVGPLGGSSGVPIAAETGRAGVDVKRCHDSHACMHPAVVGARWLRRSCPGSWAGCRWRFLTCTARSVTPGRPSHADAAQPVCRGHRSTLGCPQ